MAQRNAWDTLQDILMKLLHREGRLEPDTAADLEQEPGWSWNFTENERSLVFLATKIAALVT